MSRIEKPFEIVIAIIVNVALPRLESCAVGIPFSRIFAASVATSSGEVARVDDAVLPFALEVVELTEKALIRTSGWPVTEDVIATLLASVREQVEATESPDERRQLEPLYDGFRRRRMQLIPS